MKEYFSHDYHARTDPNIIVMLSEMKAEGYGLYWMIIEMLYENNGAIPKNYIALEYELRTPSERIQALCEKFGLFYESGETIRSHSVDRRLEERAEKSQKARNSAMIGSERRANAQRTPSDKGGIKEKESKEKKIKEKEIREESNYISSGGLSEADLVKAISGPTNRKPCPLWVKKKCIAASGCCEVQGASHISGDCYLPA